MAASRCLLTWFHDLWNHPTFLAPMLTLCTTCTPLLLLHSGDLRNNKVLPLLLFLLWIIGWVACHCPRPACCLVPAHQLLFLQFSHCSLLQSPLGLILPSLPCYKSPLTPPLAQPPLAVPNRVMEFKGSWSELHPYRPAAEKHPGSPSQFYAAVYSGVHPTSWTSQLC